MIKIFVDTKKGYLEPSLALQLLDDTEFYWVVTTTAKSINQFPFYRLSFKDDALAYKKYGGIKQELMPCGRNYRKLKAEGTTLLTKCWQKQRKRVWPEHLNGQDIVRSSEGFLLVSQKFKFLLEAQKLTGFSFEPCLLEGKNYSKEAEYFGGSLQSDTEFSDYFQLVVNEAAPAVNMGAAYKKEGKAPITPLILDVYMPTSEYFTPEILKDTDVQVVNKIQGIELHENTEFYSNYIFSHRFLQIIIDNKLKGLRSFNTKPKIDYVVVPIREEDYDDNINKGHWDVATIKANAR